MSIIKAFPKSKNFQPKLLLYDAQLKIYYLLYNIIELVQSNGFWYYFCSSIPGCQTEYGHKGWCMVCMLQLNEKFSIDYLEELKRCPLKLSLFAESVYNDIETKAEFHESIIELWDTDFSYKGRDYGKGKRWGVLLRDIIEFIFNRTDYCNFI